MLLHQAVLVSFADGQQTEKEANLLSQLADQLRIPADEARGILESGAEHARRMLHLLQNV
jgi:tellurite resistance protein